MAERRDIKNRLLGKGEYQKSDGRYMYRYVDSKGNARLEFRKENSIASAYEN